MTSPSRPRSASFATVALSSGLTRIASCLGAAAAIVATSASVGCGSDGGYYESGLAGYGDDTGYNDGGLITPGDDGGADGSSTLGDGGKLPKDFENELVTKVLAAVEKAPEVK